MSRELKIESSWKISIPDGATHFHLDSCDEKATFYKSRKIGVAGDHWFYHCAGDWKFVGHLKPQWIKPIPEDLILRIGKQNEDHS